MPDFTDTPINTFVKVVTTNLETGKQSFRIINHDDAQSRQWLGKHCYWAIRNNHAVCTTPVEEDIKDA